jgi:hypothetical protein
VPVAPDPNAALADVRNQLLRLGQQIAEMRADPGAGIGADAANGVIAELREAVRFLAERLDGVARMVAQRGEELADNRGALSAIDAHVRSQAETIGMLTTGMQALPSYGERMSGLQDNINGVQQRLSGIEGAFGPLGQRLGSIETAVSRPDSGVSERLAAIEGMLGPLSQRLGQSLTEHSASLQALHGRVEALAGSTQAGLESVAAGTQAALAVPVPSDGSAVVAELEPRLVALASELAGLRKDVSSLNAAAAAAPATATAPAAAPAPAPVVDLSPLREEIAQLLSEHTAALASAPAAVAAPAVAGGDVDAAIASAERRIKDHVDEAVLALAQTLLGKARSDAVGAVAPVDTPASAEEPAAAEPAYDDDDADTAALPLRAPAEAEADDEYDDEDADDEYGDEDEAEDYGDEAEDDGDDAAEVDFSAAGEADEPAAPAIVAWNPASSPPDEPFDQTQAWQAQPAAYDADDPNVVPERRKRWFSW